MFLVLPEKPVFFSGRTQEISLILPPSKHVLRNHRDVRAKTPAVSTLPLCSSCAVSVAHVAAARSAVEQYPGGCLDSAVGATQGVHE